MAVGDKIFIADKPTLDRVDTNVGSNEDPTSEDGSVHGKIKDVKSKLNTNLDTKVSQSGIKRVQRGTAANANSLEHTLNITISSVNTAKAFVVMSYSIPGKQDVVQRLAASIASAALTSSTNLRIIRNGGDGNPGFFQAKWQVIEFY